MRKVVGLLFSEQALREFISQTMEEMPLNRMSGHLMSGQKIPGHLMSEQKLSGHQMDGDAIWDLPMTGYAAGQDALFSFFKTDIGPFYWLPEEAFLLQYPECEHGPLTVLSLAFPHTEKTLRAQRASRLYPSDRWGYSRSFWPEFMADLSERLIAWMGKQGIRSVDPERLPQFCWQTSEKYGYASNWSQRHTAYACGLGTFSLSDGLITEKGKAVRFMSLILEAAIQPTTRAYSHYQEWCLFYKDGSCRQCIPRCPANAISVAGHNKDLCAAYGQSIRAKRKVEPDRTIGCGLCQAGVPCENRRP